MEMNVRDDRGVRVVELAGEALDAGNVPRFKTNIEPHLGAGRHVLDLSGVKFVDSSGIGALLSCLRKVGAAGGEIRLAGLQPNVASLFALVRLDRLFEIHPTAEDALLAYLNG